ncbi:hypothetical protein BXZ70DRAFT_513074 [Cristinia sonorae]|uniref:Uncharacterized protein n=1 Tax=Cristinia sonorae TaxID=1940300 RepID=A0A8K0XT70_9AGAR|nr:hypothetical protein BXZ70DRAFT_513074 [Cristinia sonorae]
MPREWNRSLATIRVPPKSSTGTPYADVAEYRLSNLMLALHRAFRSDREIRQRFIEALRSNEAIDLSVTTSSRNTGNSPSPYTEPIPPAEITAHLQFLRSIGSSNDSDRYRGTSSETMGGLRRSYAQNNLNSRLAETTPLSHIGHKPQYEITTPDLSPSSLGSLSELSQDPGVDMGTSVKWESEESPPQFGGSSPEDPQLLVKKEPSSPQLASVTTVLDGSLLASNTSGHPRRRTVGGRAPDIKLEPATAVIPSHGTALSTVRRSQRLRECARGGDGPFEDSAVKKGKKRAREDDDDADPSIAQKKHVRNENNPSAFPLQRSERSVRKLESASAKPSFTSPLSTARKGAPKRGRTTHSTPTPSGRYHLRSSGPCTDPSGPTSVPPTTLATISHSADADGVPPAAPYVRAPTSDPFVPPVDTEFARQGTPVASSSGEANRRMKIENLVNPTNAVDAKHIGIKGKMDVDEKDEDEEEKRKVVKREEGEEEEEREEEEVVQQVLGRDEVAAFLHPSSMRGGGPRLVGNVANRPSDPTLREAIWPDFFTEWQTGDNNNEDSDEDEEEDSEEEEDQLANDDQGTPTPQAAPTPYHPMGTPHPATVPMLTSAERTTIAPYRSYESPVAGPSILARRRGRSDSSEDRDKDEPEDEGSVPSRYGKRRRL